MYMYIFYVFIYLFFNKIVKINLSLKNLFLIQVFYKENLKKHQKVVMLQKGQDKEKKYTLNY
jgi:hypothetical protein